MCEIIYVCLLSTEHALQVVYTAITHKNHENAWVAKVPTWPLVVVFLGQIVSIFGGIYWVVTKGIYINFECLAIKVHDNIDY